MARFSRRFFLIIVVTFTVLSVSMNIFASPSQKERKRNNNNGFGSATLKPVIEIAQTPSPGGTVNSSPRQAIQTPTASPEFISSPVQESPVKTPIVTPTEILSPSPAPSTSSTMQSSSNSESGLDLKKVITPIAPVICCLIVILIMALILVKSKQKPKCKRCGAPVISGRIFCENCSNPATLLNALKRQEEVSMGTREMVAIPEPVAYEPRKKTLEKDISTKIIRKASIPSTKEQVVSETNHREEALRKKSRPSGRVIAVISIRKGANQGYRFNIYESLSQISIGKDPSSDIIIEDDPEISNVHAIISVSANSGFLINAIEDTAGIFVNNERVTRANLKSGDVIRLGKTELTFARL